ncbi:MAG: hypothetical protein Q9162_001791 [Coniocarpon cinnabarinum]
MDAHIEDREYHENFMREAIGMAELALRSDETPVGCVFVHNGEVVGRGMNDTNRSLNGTAHCEFIAIRQLLESKPASFLQECDLYVTVEPCIMCAALLRQFQIHAVYFGCANERFGGTGGVLNVHSDPSVDPAHPVYGGLFKEEAIMLLRRFYVQENEKAPEPHKKANRELKTEIVAHKGKANKNKENQKSAQKGGKTGGKAGADVDAQKENLQKNLKENLKENFKESKEEPKIKW